MRRIEVDVVVAGAGCFGALAALTAAKRGLRVALIERGRHPRFAIGESTTPLANLLLEELASRTASPWLATFSKWGSWQRAHPQIRCGRKRGFTFLWHPRALPFAAHRDLRDQFLVAASPNSEVADTHWLRADFDAFLVERARGAGVIYLDRFAVEEVRCSRGDCAVVGQVADRAVDSSAIAVTGRLLVDSTGPRGLLSRHLQLGERAFADLPATVALYSHVQGAVQLGDSEVYPFADGLPYPVDDAAVHHVLEDGWVWSLAFDDGLTSVGLAATPALARELSLADGEPAWRRLLERQPTLAALYGDARAVQPWTYHARLPFRSARAAGEGFVVMPAAAGFVDPLLSTGFALSLLGVLRFDKILEAAQGDLASAATAQSLMALGEQTLAEVDRAGRLVAALYSAMNDFEMFRTLTHLYFAAVHHTETRIRLRAASADFAFLGGDIPGFAAELEAICAAAIALRRAPDSSGRARAALIDRVRRTVAPIDLIGLDHPERSAWVPCDLELTMARADRLSQEVRRILPE